MPRAKKAIRVLQARAELKKDRAALQAARARSAAADITAPADFDGLMWSASGLLVIDGNGRPVTFGIVPTGSASVDSARAHVIAASLDMQAALRHAERVVNTARRYFPKSIKNPDTFALNLCAAEIGKALNKSGGK